MRKRYILSAVGLLSAFGVATYMIKNLLNEQKSDASTLEKAGIPDQIEPKDVAELENVNMVSEGSQYGVQYYNEKQEEEKVH